MEVKRTQTKIDTILVLDFGGQYCHLIGGRIREQEIYSEIVPHDISPKDIELLKEKFNVKGVILSGGSGSTYEQDISKLDPKILESGVPVLSLCCAHQILTQPNDGKVKRVNCKEYGITCVTVNAQVGVLKGLKNKEKVWMNKSDGICDLPNSFEPLAHTDDGLIAAFMHKNKPVYGLQWHPEVIHTENGTQVLQNFMFNVCKCQANWRMEVLIEKMVQEIKTEVGEGRAIIGLSGGIDSSVSTVLAARALNEKLTAVYVDHGFMREGETLAIRETFSKFKINFIVVEAQERFMKKLEGVTDPECKRKTIGEEFIRVFEEEAMKSGAQYLIQGTIYPDIIESGFSKNSKNIKSHHNVGGLPEKIGFKKILEPLRELYKDEVRKVAKMLDLPKERVNRQPFPGPGLAVRIIGLLTEEKVRIVKRSDKIVREEIEKTDLAEKLWQYFTIVTDTKATGAKDDTRIYGYVVAIRAVESREAMTASVAKISYDTLEKISTRITSEIPEVTHVVYDITHKPPATIEWE
ncbi:MAG: glutamine-hydrolyzing GMP synthase [Nitrososphaerota archaeon]|jgi:GMP synthase (glutamine-hydrolysing)|uniref:glutamine-hydrolyzing GMP synthase n=1 Tax=Candidatus Bathycorpusculum sp. TaxID=2994959 RepID=UPI00283A5C4F|nr:glutamine-hydrolyzing GMP synthase [Candidatus Termiticorpusculum sp.]MCL2258031.1 glutamine-hydrolyzing GMP synthase [Candidatus Termiticorpusculum sp.]MCL2291747.1 glutamine-hydrolyzing GMP synthase [Candidatus Termiticorpusculum sp.]MDR0461488.1 glutamine-hydrolyzing GMP synthase [Nitrososphaerota archaeon]